MIKGVARLGCLRLSAAVSVWVLFVVVGGPAGLSVEAVSASEPGSGRPALVVANAGSLSDVGTAASLVASGVGDAVVFSAASDSLGSGSAAMVSARMPARVLLVGGTAVLSAAVERQVGVLAPGAVVDRLAGDDRVHTAALAAGLILDAEDSATVVIANGWSLSDVGTAASAVASGRGDVVLYAGAGALGDPTRAVLEEHRPAAMLIVGGSAALSDAVASDAGRAAGGVVPRRLGGDTRVETAALSAREAFDAGATVAVIADGWSLDDVGVAAAISASMDRSAVLYARRGDLGVVGAKLLAERPPSAVLLVDVNGNGTSGVRVGIAELVPDAAVGVISDRFQAAGYRRDGVTAAAVSLSALGAEAEAVPLAGRVSVSWPQGQPTAGSQRPGYEVQWRTQAGAYNSTDKVVVTSESFSIDGLSDGTAYTVRVRPAAIDVLSVGGATVTAAADAEPVARVGGGPAPPDEALEVSALDGPLSIELAGEQVWPVTIEIPVDAAKIAAGDRVGLFYYDENLEQWMPEPTAAYDPQRSVVTAQVYHLSWWLPLVFPAFWVTSRWDGLAGFARQNWDAASDWLRAGWYRTQDFLLSDVPLLAAQVLDQIAATGRAVPSWVQTALKRAKDLPAQAVAQFVQLVQTAFGTRIDAPTCLGPLPPWIADIDVAADDDHNNDPADIPLLVCGETTTPVPTTREDLRLKVGMNRGFSMSVKAYAPTGTQITIQDAHPSNDTLTFDGYERDAAAYEPSTQIMRALVKGFDTGEVILPGGEVALIHTPQSAYGQHQSLTFRAELAQIPLLLDTLLFGIEIYIKAFDSEKLKKLVMTADDVGSCMYEHLIADRDGIDKVRSAIVECISYVSGLFVEPERLKSLEKALILYTGTGLLVNYAEAGYYVFTGNTEDFTVTRTGHLVVGDDVVSLDSEDSSGADSWWAQPRGNLTVNVHVCVENGLEHHFTRSDLVEYAEHYNRAIAPFYSWQSSGLLNVRFEPGQIIVSTIAAEAQNEDDGENDVAPNDCVDQHAAREPHVAQMFIVYQSNEQVYLHLGGRAFLEGGPGSLYLHHNALPYAGFSLLDLMPAAKPLNAASMWVFQHELDHVIGIPHYYGGLSGPNRVHIYASGFQNNVIEWPPKTSASIPAAVRQSHDAVLGTLDGYPEVFGHVYQPRFGTRPYRVAYEVYPCYVLRDQGWPVGDSHPACVSFPPSRPNVSMTVGSDGSVHISWQPGVIDSSWKLEPTSGYQVEVTRIHQPGLPEEIRESILDDVAQDTATRELLLPGGTIDLTDFGTAYQVVVTPMSAAGPGGLRGVAQYQVLPPLTQIIVEQRPGHGSVGPPIEYDLTWPPAPGASSYRIIGFETCDAISCAEPVDGTDYALSDVYGHIMTGEIGYVIEGKSYNITVFACGGAYSTSRILHRDAPSGCFISATTTIMAEPPESPTTPMLGVELTSIGICSWLHPDTGATVPCSRVTWPLHPNADVYFVRYGCGVDGSTRCPGGATGTANLEFADGRRVGFDGLDWPLGGWADVFLTPGTRHRVRVFACPKPYDSGRCFEGGDAWLVGETWVTIPQPSN